MNALYCLLDEESQPPFSALLGEVECGSDFSLQNADHAAWLAQRLHVHRLTGVQFLGCRSDDGRPLGIVGVLVPTWPSLEQAPRAAELTHLIVEPAHRRSGCGAELVARAEALAASRNAYSMYVRTAAVNRAAIALYERAGYILTATLPDVYGPGQGHDVIYRKIL